MTIPGVGIGRMNSMSSWADLGRLRAYSIAASGVSRALVGRCRYIRFTIALVKLWKTVRGMKPKERSRFVCQCRAAFGIAVQQIRLTY